MPETTGEVKINLFLTNEDFVKLSKLKIGEKVFLTYCIATRTPTQVLIETLQEVTLEFDFADYLPDRDEP